MVVDNKHHILNIKEEEFQEKYRPIIRKLQKAIEEPEIKNKMELEDGLLDELEDLDREIEVLAEENKKMKIEKELVKLKLDSVESEKELVKQMLDSVESENQRMKLELENLRKELNNKH